MFRITILLVALSLSLMAFAQSAPEIEVSPAQSLDFESNQIVVSGLEPWVRATVRVSTTFDNKPYAAEASFQANADGMISVHSQAPLSGSYTGVDPFGLFWSMTEVAASSEEDEENGDEPAPENDDPSSLPEPREYRVSVAIEGEELASADFQRTSVKEGVRAIQLNEGRLRGVLWLPPGEGPHPAFLVVSGSGGGYPNQGAMHLANRGYAALALAYFAAPDLPEQLAEIPLEYFTEGIDWLAEQPTVDSERLGIMGGSRGGELSLLLASIEPRLKTVVAWVPSNVVWGACCSRETRGLSSWTVGGEPLPYPEDSEVSLYSPSYWPEAAGPLGYFWLALANEQSAKAAEIKVEQSQAAILMISGGKDELWPSTYMADSAMYRLEQNEYPHPFVHIKFDDAGHAVGRSAPDHPVDRIIEATHPVTKTKLQLGGTREAMAAAPLEAWRLVEEFLQENL